jgi:hypothetical protein
MPGHGLGAMGLAVCLSFQTTASLSVGYLLDYMRDGYVIPDLLEPLSIEKIALRAHLRALLETQPDWGQ